MITNKMKNDLGTIEIIIGSDTTGYNTHEENLLYINALRSALEAEYPGATISVEMGENSSIYSWVPSKFDYLDRDNEKIHTIKQQVWDKMEYPNMSLTNVMNYIVKK